jgi:predicted ATPase/DNA-binding winged helix-turn-helix (wHTH) protein
VPAPKDGNQPATRSVLGTFLAGPQRLQLGLAFRVAAVSAVNDPPSAGTLEKFVYHFDCFTLDPQRRTLLRGDDSVHLGSRALDLLIALVERSGEVLSRDYLVSQVWPSTFVEESSLRVHIAALRRVLSEGREDLRFIANAPGRGYSFVTAVSRHPIVASPVQARTVAGAHPAPAEILGREHALTVVQQMVERHRIVSIVGYGGVGKTLLAQHVLHRIAHHFGNDPIAIDLSRVENGSVRKKVTGTLTAPEGDTANLASRAGFLFLDSCERVLDEVAELTQELRSRAPNLKIVCTSREPLDVPDEHVFRLDPLELPNVAVSSLSEAMDSGAVALFVMRARANGAGAVFHDDDAGALARLCAQLDGLPLAIELAATRFSALGLAGLLARRDEQLDLLTRGRRTADSRHRSMRASIEWSYELLTEAERTVFAMLSVFQSNFSLSMVAAVAPPGMAVTQAVLRLVDRSLVAAGGIELPETDDTGFRMPETIRSFARERLNESPEGSAVRRRHAEETLRRLELHDNHRERASAAVSGLVDDLLCAVDWLNGAEVAPELSLRLLHAGLWAIAICGRTEEFDGLFTSALETLRKQATVVDVEEAVRLEVSFVEAMRRRPARAGEHASARAKVRSDLVEQVPASAREH